VVGRSATSASAARVSAGPTSPPVGPRQRHRPPAPRRLRRRRLRTIPLNPAARVRPHGHGDRRDDGDLLAPQGGKRRHRFAIPRRRPTKVVAGLREPRQCRAAAGWLQMQRSRELAPGAGIRGNGCDNTVEPGIPRRPRPSCEGRRHHRPTASRSRRPPADRPAGRPMLAARPVTLWRQRQGETVAVTIGACRRNAWRRGDKPAEAEGRSRRSGWLRSRADATRQARSRRGASGSRRRRGEAPAARRSDSGLQQATSSSRFGSDQGRPRRRGSVDDPRGPGHAQEVACTLSSCGYGSRTTCTGLARSHRRKATGGPGAWVNLAPGAFSRKRFFGRGRTRLAEAWTLGPIHADNRPPLWFDRLAGGGELAW